MMKDFSVLQKSLFTDQVSELKSHRDFEHVLKDQAEAQI